MALCVSFGLTSAWTAPSRADDCASDPHACAVSLFEAGRRLLEAGNWQAAIPVFQKSLEQQPTIGALLNLGDCDGKAGRPWEAYVQYRAAARLAKVTNDPRREAAEGSARSVAPLVLRVKLVTEEAGGAVRIDDTLVPNEYMALLLAGEYALSPSVTHAVEVTSSPGVLWRGEVQGPAGAEREIVVHERAASGASPAPAASAMRTGEPEGPSSPPPPSPSPPNDRPGSGLRLAGIVTAGAGGVGLVIGVVAGAIALGDLGHARSLCDASGGTYPASCNGSSAQDVRSANAAANGAATASTIGFVVGGMALAVGGVLYFLAPNVSVSVAQTPGGAGVLLRQTW
jgi:hypothetical protein